MSTKGTIVKLKCKEYNFCHRIVPLESFILLLLHMLLWQLSMQEKYNILLDFACYTNMQVLWNDEQDLFFSKYMLESTRWIYRDEVFVKLLNILYLACAVH